jgi:DNA modification methylase
MVKPKLNKFRIIILILIIVIVGGASFAGWYIWQKNKPVESQQTNSKITRYKGLNILQDDWHTSPDVSFSEYNNFHYSSLEKGQLIEGGFVVDEVSNDYIIITIPDNRFEESNESTQNDSYDIGKLGVKQTILYNNKIKIFSDGMADAGTTYLLLFIK